MTPLEYGPDLRITHPSVNPDYAVLTEVLSQIKLSRPEFKGWALEFGVATGKTLRLIAEVLPVIGFDSFEGLPEDWRTDFPAGTFAGVRPDVDVPNATLVEGQFLETVPDYDWPDFIRLVHIDCDLYSSTKTVLDSLIGQNLKGAYVVFDEFFGYPGCEAHERKAWDEFVESQKIEYDVVGHGREQFAVCIR